MQKLQDSVFSIIKTTNLSPAVFSFLQPTEEFTDKTPLGGILNDTKHGWLALGPKFCVIDLRSGLKIAARTFGNGLSSHTSVTSVVELPTPLTPNSKQLVISLECDDVTGMICVFHINSSQLLHCIQTNVVVSEVAVCNDVPNGPFVCFDGLVMAGTRRGEVFVFDLNRTCLVDALKNISQGYEDEIHNEANAANVVFLPLKAVHKIESQRDLAVDNHDHLAVLLNESSLVDNQYIFRNPDGTVRMKAKRDHIRVTVIQYIPQLASLAVGFNFGAFQIWNLLNLELEFTSQVNVECLPVTHFGFQEPCDDPRAFCYLWVVFSVIDRFEEEEFPLAVMYSLTYQGKRMLSENACLYQEFSMASIRFQVELSTIEETSRFVGGRCVSCHTYSINSSLGDDGDDSIYTNICQLVWECWGEHANKGAEHGMLLFDLDQWYKDQMPATYKLESNAFMSTTWCKELARGDCLTLDVRLDPASVLPYSHATRLEEHFYPNSLQYNCISLNTSEVILVQTTGVQRQTVGAMAAAGPACLLAPNRLRAACHAAGLTPLYTEPCAPDAHPDEQRRYLLSVALEARLSSFLKRCAHDWATGTHTGAGCTLPFLVNWCWKRAIELKENAKELTAPLFTSSTLPDRNVIKCLEHCVQQLTQLTGLLDAVLTKCCNLVVPDALSEMEEKFKGIGTVSLYFQVVQWFLRVGLLPERHDAYTALPYPAQQLYTIYKKRRLKLQRLEDKLPSDNENESCSLLYIDQLIEHEFGGEKTHNMWIRGGSECGGLYPPPSLYSLLRLYLLPDIAEEHKHSLVLYLLVDYSMVYDDVQYEEVIRRLMQFPTMFGLSNTAIKATQAFWHLDHRDFDFALDQLQCLTGNTLSEWQHNVVLSSLLAQKKTQAALQYLHVRKPAPIQNLRDKDADYNRLSDHDKLDDWQSCCNLYLARGLVFEALDVIRMCVQNAGSAEDKMQVLNFFFKGCRNTGQLSKVLNVTLMPLEEEVFIKYLQNCNEPQTSDVLIMYYLQQARYVEAEQYNNKIKSKGRPKEFSMSAESLLDVMDREGARDTLVEVVCSALPPIANSVARCARVEFEPHIIAPKPMSVFVQARSPKNTFTYKSSFIQDTIENASETWVNKPQMRRGIKRALNVEETPFICTPKLFRTKSLFPEQPGNESTPPKRAKLNFSGTPKTPKMQTPRVSEKLSKQMATLLDMPEVQSPNYKTYTRSGAGTPQSILKNRRADGHDREAPSPADSRYLGESDDELLETASNHTLYSDSKHLRFTIPTASEDGSTPSPVQPKAATAHIYKIERPSDDEQEDEQDEMPPAVSPPKKLAVEEVKPRKFYKDTVKARRSLSISANSSLSDDPNTSIESIADIPITIINAKYFSERHLHREKTPKLETEDTKDANGKEREIEEMDSSIEFSLPVPRTPQGRKGIRSVVAKTSTFNRSRSVTPERVDSPVVTPMQITRSRSKSRTPEVSPRASPLAPIPELPKLESNAEPHPAATLLSVARPLRSRSRTPEKIEVTLPDTSRLEPITESPTKTSDIQIPARPSSRRSLRHRSKTPERLEKEPETPILEAISESPTTISNTESPVYSPTRRSLRHKSKTPERLHKEVTTFEQIVESPATSSNTESPGSSPSRRSLRSRSRTPDIEIVSEQPVVTSPRSLRSRSKTPEKLMSPKKETGRTKKSLSRMVLEANAFAKTKQNIENIETESESKNTEEEGEISEEKMQSAIECTPMKSSKDAPKLMDVTFSPIVHKSILQSSSESVFSVSTQNATKTGDEDISLNPLPAFTSITETYTEKSVLHSYQSSIAESSSICIEEKKIETGNETQNIEVKSLQEFNTINETGFGKSVLKSFQSSIVESSAEESRLEKMDEIPKTLAALKSLNETDFGKSVLRSEDSSVAITSDESFKDRKDMEATRKDISSLMTDDSDIEMKDWEHKMDSQETARVIQKEKEKIVEIQREINEIEDDMSDDCQVDDDSDLDEEDVVDEEESEVESSESDENESESGQEIISIEDSDDSADGKSNEEQVKNIELLPAPHEKEEEEIQTVDVQNDNGNVEMVDVTQETTDPLNQAQISMLTDDNSVVESDSIDLNYSDEVNKEKNVAKVDQTKTDHKEIEIKVVVEEFDPTTTGNKEEVLVAQDIDVVDAVMTSKQVVEKVEELKKNVIENPTVVEMVVKKRIQENVEKTTSEKDVKENTPEVGVKEKALEKKVKERIQEENVKETSPEKDVKVKTPEEGVEEKTIEKESKERILEKNVTETNLEKDVKKKTPEDGLKEKAIEEEVKERILEKNVKDTSHEEDGKEKTPEEEVKEKAIKKTVKEKSLDTQFEETISEQKFKEKPPEKELNEKSSEMVVEEQTYEHIRTENIPEKKVEQKSPECEVKEKTPEKELNIKSSEMEVEEEKSFERKDKENTSESERKDKSSKMEVEEEGLKTQVKVKTTEKEAKEKCSDVEKKKETTEKQIMAVEEEGLKAQVNVKTTEKEAKEKCSDVDKKKETTEKQVEVKVSETEIKEKPLKKEIKKDKSPEEEVKHKTVVKESIREEVVKEKSVNEELIIETKSDLDTEMVEDKPTTLSRKRTKSTSSTKLTMDVDKSVVTEEPKTRKTRKRTQSTSSNKSNDDDLNTEETKTAEEQKTPSRARSKTPVKELRMILTRRASRELGEKLDDADALEAVTPKRRARKNKVDDSEASDIKSIKGIVDSDVKPSPGRKGRKKPELSVIPEVVTEESGMKESSEDIIKEYSGSRRLTRHQKSMLETWLEPTGLPPRRPSAASRSDASLEGDDDTTSTPSTPASPAFDVQPIDTVSLNLPTYDGAPDEEEFRRTESPLSFLSETRPRNRLARAASESKTTPRPARITRKASVDVVLGTPELGSPAGGSSPARSRRASFTKACEALHTPKGRRTSVDAKKGESESQTTSPVVTPLRRSRRTPSATLSSSASATTSNTSNRDTPTRTRKLSEKKE